MLAPKYLDQKTILGLKNVRFKQMLGQHFFVSNRFWVLKMLMSEKVFDNKFMVRNLLGPENFKSKRCWDPKNVGAGQIFWSKTIVP